jgi:uncharacterized membrane protein
MKKAIAILVLVTCCIAANGIKLECEVKPSKVSLDDPKTISIEAHVSNIGTSIQTVDVDVVKTEGIEVVKPERTRFTLKQGESRVVTFYASLMEDTVPGNYIIDIEVKTQEGDVVKGKAKIIVVKEKGFI